MKPRVAIPVPTSTDLAYNQRSWPMYAEAVARSGGEPIEIPLNATPTEIANLINTCQAVVLPGSPADVNPHKYGQDPIPECSAPDPARENVDELLIQDAHNPPRRPQRSHRAHRRSRSGLAPRHDPA